MFSKYSEDSELMDFLPKPISASFISPPVNTSDICCHPKASPWLHTKSRFSRIGQSPKRLKTFNPSLALPTSTNFLFMDTPKSPWHSHASPERVSLGTLLISADQLLKHLKKL